MEETGRSCGWKSSYWKAWFEGLDLNLDVNENCEVLVVEIEDEDDCEPPMMTLESGMGLPPPADEDRQVGPVLYHDHSQGGPTQSKLDHGLVPREDQRCSETSTGVPPMGQITALRAEPLIEAKTRFAKFIGRR